MWTAKGKPGATFFNGWKYVVVKETAQPQNKTLEGQSIAAIAAAQGKDPLDAFLDMCVAENCTTEFLKLKVCIWSSSTAQ